MAWEMQTSAGWVDAPFKPPARLEEGGKKCTFTFGGLACTVHFTSLTEATVTAKDKTYPARPKTLTPLDSHEEERKLSQKRVSAVANAEQMRIIADMEHAEHEAKAERQSARKSVLEAMEAERKSQISEHGEGIRKVPSVPCPVQLADVVPSDWQHHEGEAHPDTVKKEEMQRASLVPLDDHEHDRKVSQRKVSRASEAEQLRVIAEMEHAEHEAKQERKSNRKSALEAMEAERASQVKEHGETVRKVPTVPDAAQLEKHFQDNEHTVH